MKFAASLLLGLLAVAATQGKSLDPWEKKVRELEVKFEKVVDRKATLLINKVKHVVADTQTTVKDFVEELERDINATVAYALKEIEVLKLDVSIECYRNASQDLLEAQEAAIYNLAGCRNLSVAIQDVQQIAQNASEVVLDIVKDARLIIEGVAECGSETGFDKFECVVKYVAEELRNLVSQWPEAKRFIATVKTLGGDAERQVNACMNDPIQQSLDKQVQQALDEFSACSQQSASKYGAYVV